MNRLWLATKKTQRIKIVRISTKDTKKYPVIHKKQKASEKSLPALYFHLRHWLENLDCVGTVAGKIRVKGNILNCQITFAWL